MLKDETQYDTLKAELIIDMTKIYMYADIDRDCQNKFLNIMKPYYNDYKISTRVNTANLQKNKGSPKTADIYLSAPLL